MEPSPRQWVSPLLRPLWGKGLVRIIGLHIHGHDSGCRSGCRRQSAPLVQCMRVNMDDDQWMPIVTIPGKKPTSSQQIRQTKIPQSLPLTFNYSPAYISNPHINGSPGRRMAHLG